MTVCQASVQDPTYAPTFSITSLGMPEQGYHVPPRLACPLPPSTMARDPVSLPLLVYFSGIDGSGMAAARQFPSLLAMFDMRHLLTARDDHTPFADMVGLVVSQLEAEVGTASPARPVYLLGESFGGLLALAVAAAAPHLVDRLVLVNPATSYPRSIWPMVAPYLLQTPPALYKSVLPLVMAPLIGNPVSLLAAGVRDGAGQESAARQAAALLQTARTLWAQLPRLADVLPQETLAWKLELIRQGCEHVGPLLPRIGQRCLILMGTRDMLIPSGSEGPRLARLLPRARLKALEGASHSALQEMSQGLGAVLEEEGFYIRHRRLSAPLESRASPGGRGEAGPVEVPGVAEIDRYAASATRLTRRLTSPVFLSTCATTGRRVRSLDHLPRPAPGRPVLLVGNHQTLSADLPVLCEEVLRQTGVLLRGLAHPLLSHEAEAEPREARPAGPWDALSVLGGAALTPGGGRGSSFSQMLETFGAVRVSPRNMFRLLSNGEAILLFPGGMREAYKGRGEEYRLFWPDRSEFVRMAARFGATIVPFAAVGIDDSLNILLDPSQVQALPFVGDALRRRQALLPQARSGPMADAGWSDGFVPPVSIPRGAPQRLYFLFQAPIHTDPSEARDRQACDALHSRIKGSVQEGIDFLLQARASDPYAAATSRLLRESLHPGQPAPTFPL